MPTLQEGRLEVLSPHQLGQGWAVQGIVSSWSCITPDPGSDEPSGLAAGATGAIGDAIPTLESGEISLVLSSIRESNGDGTAAYWVTMRVYSSSEIFPAFSFALATA